MDILVQDEIPISALVSAACPYNTSHLPHPPKLTEMIKLFRKRGDSKEGVGEVEKQSTTAHAEQQRSLMKPKGAASSSVVVLSDKTFTTMTKGDYSIIDFWAPWCAPCRRLSPMFDEFSERYGDSLRFARCNVDQNPRCAKRFEIMSIPTLVLLDPSGREVDRIIGLPSKRRLERFLEGVLANSGEE